jgi:hypothetical protein
VGSGYAHVLGVIIWVGYFSREEYLIYTAIPDIAPPATEQAVQTLPGEALSLLSKTGYPTGTLLIIFSPPGGEE